MMRGGINWEYSSFSSSILRTMDERKLPGPADCFYLPPENPYEAWMFLHPASGYYQMELESKD